MATTKKPVDSRSSDAGRGSLPYPTTPVSPKYDAKAFDAGYDTAQLSSHSPCHLDPTPSQSQMSIATVSDLSEGWTDGDPGAQDNFALSKLSLHNTQATENAELPGALRIGASGYAPKASLGNQRDGNKVEVPSALRVQTPQGGHSTNPFHRNQVLEGQSNSTQHDESGVQDSSDIWAEFAVKPLPPSAAPPPPPPEALSAGYTRSDLDSLESGKRQLPLVSANRPSLPGTEAFMAGARSNESYIDLGQAPLAEAPNNPSADLSEHGAGSSPWAGEYERKHLENQYGEMHELDAQPTSITANPFGATTPADEHSTRPWPVSNAVPSTASLADTPTKVIKEQQNIEEPEYRPPLPIDTPNTSTRSAAPSETETSSSKAQKQRSETYQIKHIQWLDSTSSEARTTPIMVQNGNGPCPLLALVNALTLSTPARISTPLVETLRVREQVTLGLLLDAVFDELMSGRRGSAAQGLPDVSELYSFLINLHTGLNVNPRFTSVSEQPATTLSGVNSVSPQSQESRKFGGFEDTKEMELYGTFSIPLIHGWLPPRTHPAHLALQRSANTYEDAQNLLFREEELEDKLQTQGLSSGEQQLLEDIASTKYFLSSSATQLTGYGLDTITDTLFPGSIAILFRNDHFSTLYKHPRTGQVLTLVTDAGYADHQEIVWESLVDVSGEGSEFYSGDFRPVGNNANASTPAAYSQQDESGWMAVPRSHRTYTNEGRPQAQPTRPALQPVTNGACNTPSLFTTEQEDADLALALQLQEEEEENDRRAAQSRRRGEEQASQAYLSSQITEARSPPTQVSNQSGGRRRFSNRGNNNIPPPSSSRSNNRDITRPLPLPPRRNVDPEAGDDAPPPSYEDASKTEPYQPPPLQPPRPNIVTSGPSATSMNTQSAYNMRQNNFGRRTSGPMGGLDESMYGGHARQRTGGPPGQTSIPGGGRDKDCIVM
jgi:hypothetical protein